MIYTFSEQFKMMIYFIVLGMFLLIMLDSIHLFFSKVNILNYILQLICWIIVSIICIKSVNKISDGYLPIYILFFFLIGGIIYHYLLRKSYIKVLLKIKKKRQDLLLALFPVKLYNYIIKRIKKIFKNRRTTNEKNDLHINNNDDFINNSGM